jgi:hypothetical protein
VTSDTCILERLTEAIGLLNRLDDMREAELEALRADVLALSNRVESLTRLVQARTEHLA